MSDYVYDVVVRSRDNTGALTAEYYSTEGIATTSPHSVAANTHFQGRVRQPGVLEFHMWAKGCTRGPRPVASGGAAFSNSDGNLDGWTSKAFDGCEYEVWRALRSQHNGNSHTKVFLGISEQAAVKEDEASLVIYDVMHLLERPVLTTRYAGTNSLPNGLEGTSADLQGRVKPRPMGVVKNVSVPCVNTSRLVYQVSDVQLESGWAITVYVNRATVAAGVLRPLSDMQAGATATNISAINTATDTITTVVAHSLTTGDPVSVTNSGGSLPGGLFDTVTYYARVLSATTLTLHSTQAGALANTGIVDITSAGTGTNDVAKNRTAKGLYDFCNDASAGFYIRFGSDTTGLAVTCDVTAPIVTSVNAFPAGVTNCEVHVLVQRLLKLATGRFPLGMSAFLNDYPDVGIWIDSEMTYLEAANQLAQSVSAGFYFNQGSNSTAVMRQIFEPTTGSASIDFNQTNVLSAPQLIPSGDDDRGMPVWRVNVNYWRNYTVMSPANLPGVALPDTNFVQREWRTVTVEDASVKTQWPNAPEITVFCLTSSTSSATSEANRLLNAYKVKRQMYALEVALEDAIDRFLGEIVTITWPRYGLSAGKKVLIVAMQLNFDRGTVQLVVWG